MLDQYERSQLLRRRDRIKQWLAAEAPYAMADQKHLDACTPERAYWHYGYQAALTDMMQLLNTPGRKCGSADIPSSSPEDAQDGERFRED